MNCNEEPAVAHHLQEGVFGLDEWEELKKALQATRLWTFEAQEPSSAKAIVLTARRPRDQPNKISSVPGHHHRLDVARVLGDDRVFGVLGESLSYK